jgi:Asp-tRNA(Asn)/Glu-tRNA(Gln) amidotransferase A subunit family amidase
MPTSAEARARIAARRELNAFISLTTEEGAGVVVAVKDTIDVAGMVTTCGAQVAREPARRDAEVVRRIRAAGGVLIGKTNLQPWAFGVTSANPWWGDVGHPRDPRHNPGGSSGGSAVAVACGMCDWALGTDAGGSVRLPAALCGTVGFKPTQGVVSMDGVAPLAPSLDTMGILAPDVSTTAAAYAICTGQAAVRGGPRDAAVPRLGLPAAWIDGLDSHVAAVFHPLRERFPEVAVPDRTTLARSAMTILLAEAAQVHGEMLAAHPEAFPDDLRAALRLGLSISAAEYHAALDFRQQALTTMADAMSGLDALLLPTVGRVAPVREDVVHAKDLTRYALAINLTGQPAISLPAPVAGWPVGVQLVGRSGGDWELLETAAKLEACLSSWL